MLALIGHNALFSYLTRLHKYGYVCPLHSFCEKEKYDKDVSIRKSALIQEITS